jgi:hypothetical protein
VFFNWNGANYYVIGYQISEQGLAFGTPAIAVAGTNLKTTSAGANSIDVCALSSTSALAVYSTNGAVYAQAFTLNTSTLAVTAGTASSLFSGSPANGLACATVSPSLAFVCCNNGTNFYVFTVSVSGTTCAQNSFTLAVIGTGVTIAAAAVLSSTLAHIVYLNSGSVYVNRVPIAGTAAPGWGTPVSLPNESMSIYGASIVALNATTSATVLPDVSSSKILRTLSLSDTGSAITVTDIAFNYGNIGIFPYMFAGGSSGAFLIVGTFPGNSSWGAQTAHVPNAAVSTALPPSPYFAGGALYATGGCVSPLGARTYGNIGLLPYLMSYAASGTYGSYGVWCQEFLIA